MVRRAVRWLKEPSWEREKDRVFTMRNHNVRKARALTRKRFARISLLLAVVVVAGFATALVGASTARAAVIVTIDAQGANDEPGQKDLTRFTSDDASPAGQLLVSFSHDKTGFTGSNTGDGCLLFDTDGDLKANFSLCTTFGGTPATELTTRLYSCGDDSAFKCTQPITELSGFASTCDVAQTNTDPFPGPPDSARGEDYPVDTTSTCTVVLADFGLNVTATLIDACSYPSQQPNSDPSDCVLQSTGAPTAVTLRAFAASRTAKGVVLRWRTGAETQTLGFNIFRQVGAKKVKVNVKLIAGSNLLGGQSYTYLARNTGGAHAKYWLQSVDLRGGLRFLASATS